MNHSFGIDIVDQWEILSVKLSITAHFLSPSLPEHNRKASVLYSFHSEALQKGNLIIVSNENQTEKAVEASSAMMLPM